MNLHFKQNCQFFIISMILSLTNNAFATDENISATDETRNNAWSQESSWLYDALTARFADHAGEYQSALLSIAEVAEQSGEYDAFSYSYQLAIETLQLPRAESLAQEWLKKYPQDLQAEQALLRAFLISGKNDDAYQLIVAMLNHDAGPQAIATITRLLTYTENGDERFVILKRLSNHFPRNPYIYYYLGLIAKEQGYIHAAIDAFDNAIVLDNSWRQLKFLQAEALSSTGALTQAKKIMDELQEKSPEDGMVLSIVIDMLVYHYRWEEALKYAAEWQKLNPNEQRISQLMAWLYLNAGDYSAALIAYRELLDKGIIDYDEYLLQASKASEVIGNYEVAIRYLESINHNSTLYLSAWQSKALILFKMGEQARAQKEFALLREEFSDYALDTYLIECNQLLKRGQSKLAQQLLLEALQTYPEQVDLLYSLAEAQTINNEINAAANTYQKILTIDPANIDALNAYGYLLLTHTDNNREKAREMISKAIEAYPDSPAIQDSYGWLLYQQGDIKNALTWLRRAYAAYRLNEITPHYIEVLVANGERELATEIYQNESRGQPENKLLQNTGIKFNLGKHENNS